MTGIVSYGAYLPRFKLEGAKITEVLGEGGGRGTRSVAGYDEDTTSMGVEAARNARWSDDFAPAAVHFATTAPAYADKTNAAAIHAALRLEPTAFAGDHGGGSRAGVAAMRAAAVEGGLAVLSDQRIGRPGSADEAGGGDGAAAFLFGEDNLAAELIGQSSVSSEFLDRWRVPGETASSIWEERFGVGIYLELLETATKEALGAAGIEAPDRVVIASPHGRAAATAAKGFGESVVSVAPAIGQLGAAHLGVELAAALDAAKPGETILALSASDGADAMVFKVTDGIGSRPAGGGVAEQIALAGDVDYPTYLTWRGILRREPPRRPDPVRYEAPPSARATEWKFGFVASKCTACGRVHAPPSRVCAGCGATDQMEDHPLAGVKGTVATYTIDRLAFSLSPPTVSAAIDFDGGGRFSCELTDCTPDDVEVGTRVEMTFRRMYSAAGVHNYFWKGRPLMDQGKGARDGE